VLRLSRSIAAVALPLLNRAEIQSPIASMIAKVSARKKLVVATSLRAKSEPLIRMAPEADIITTSAAINASAAIRMLLRQKCSTAPLALAGMATAKR
jgi:hypothetical protein